MRFMVFRMKPYEEGAAAFFRKEAAGTNPYRFANQELKFNEFANQELKFKEWSLGWYKTAYELDKESLKKYGKCFHELD